MQKNIPISCARDRKGNFFPAYPFGGSVSMQLGWTKYRKRYSMIFGWTDAVVNYIITYLSMILPLRKVSMYSINIRFEVIRKQIMIIVA